MGLAKVDGQRTIQVRDHRIDIAEKKRVLMQRRLLDATMRVFAQSDGVAPIIDDVIREAKVSRGTFYNYFDSLEAVLLVIGQELSNQMTTETLPAYDVLKEPWQRFSVGTRLFLLRALLDRQWAGFVTHAMSWSDDSLMAKFMGGDLADGKKLGQFRFDDLQVAANFITGATAHGIEALGIGVKNPLRYIDGSVRMALASLGCERSRCDEGVTFSASYVRAWIDGKLAAPGPQWALNMSPKIKKEFLASR